MPPQQGYALPDFVDEFFCFRAHGWMGLSMGMELLNRRGT